MMKSTVYTLFILFIVGFLFSCSAPKEYNKELEQELISAKAELSKKERELIKAKEKQGILRTILNDTEEVNLLEYEIEELQTKIIGLEEEIEEGGFSISVEDGAQLVSIAAKAKPKSVSGIIFWLVIIIVGVIVIIIAGD